MNKTLCNSIVESVAGNVSRVVITAVALMLTCTNLAFAEEEPGTDGWTKDFSVAIGAKVWVNEWRTSFSPVNKPGAVITVLSKDTEPTPIPVASVRYKNFFISGSYYPETEFDFNDFSQVVSVPVR